MEPLLERERELAAVERLLAGDGGVLVIEGRAGIGKSSLLDAARTRGAELGHTVLHARGSELEAGFAQGVVLQLLERRLAEMSPHERDAVLRGPAAAARSLLLGGPGGAMADDASFAVLHGLYWVAANLAADRPVLISVDDAHWADSPSLRWLAYLAARLEGLDVALVVARRPGEPATADPGLLAVVAEARAVQRPALLSESAVGEIVRRTVASDAGDELCAAVHEASGGNPLYARELLRAADQVAGLDPAAVVARGREGIALQVNARVRRLDPQAVAVAHALAVLGDGCDLRHAAAIAGVDVAGAVRVVAELVRAEVLVADAPPRFIHPVVRDAIATSMPADQRDRAHRIAARALHLDRAHPGQVAAHLVQVRPAGDAWVLARLREAAQAATEGGTPEAAAGLLQRALDEPPAPGQRIDVLREAARAHAAAGHANACALLEQAGALAGGARERAEIALEIADAHATLFRWMDAVDAIEPALADLGEADDRLAARLEGELVVSGLHDARRASRVAPVLERLASRPLEGAPAEALAVAEGMAQILAGRPADQAAAPLETALASAAPRAESWNTRAALLWSLITAERFTEVESALDPMLAEVRRSGSARGLVAVHSSLALLKLRTGDLPQADAAARVALGVLEAGDFAPGLGFAAVSADIAIEAGDLDEARALLDALSREEMPAGVAGVLVPAALGRLALADGRPADALAAFESCLAMFSADVWGIELRDTGYVHARSGAALALLRLGERDRARLMADGELRDVRAFGASRALGVALRAAGLARAGAEGLELLEESVASLRASPARLELARSLAELGAAMRRAGHRAAARDPLSEALDLAARCGARPLAARAREELLATGARPRREWRVGMEALTPSELRVARMAADGRTNREIAQELYVALKTVEGHLARAYAKLAIKGRGELPAVLDREKTRVATL